MTTNFILSWWSPKLTITSVRVKYEDKGKEIPLYLPFTKWYFEIDNKTLYHL
jgi:hypothetical protein